VKKDTSVSDSGEESSSEEESSEDDSSEDSEPVRGKKGKQVCGLFLKQILA